MALAGCDQAPDEAAARAVLDERLDAALKPPVTEVARFRRIGSGPLPATADGKARRIVYFNAILKLNAGRRLQLLERPQREAFATLLGATERGVIGIKQDGNKAGDELRVHGSATFVDENGTWRGRAMGAAAGRRRARRRTIPGRPARPSACSTASRRCLTGGGGDRASCARRS